MSGMFRKRSLGRKCLENVILGGARVGATDHVKKPVIRLPGIGIGTEPHI